MQSITITGRLGKDAKQFTSAKGVPFYSFSVAVDSKVKGNEVTTWYSVVMPDNDRFKNMFKYLKKGTSVIVIGDLNATLDTYNGSTRMNLVISANNVYFNGNSSKQNNSQTVSLNANQVQENTNKLQQPQQQSYVATNNTSEQPFVSTVDVENDLPF